MKQKLKKMITMLCVCLIFFSGAFIELKTDFVFEAIVIGQDIAYGMLRILDRYTTLKENWFEKVLVYRSMLKENFFLVNCCLSTNLYSGGWRLTRTI